MTQTPEPSAPEVLFYQLGHQPLERVLPGLLLRTLERGWRAVVQVGNAERLEAIDTVLWTFSEESFLPHGTAREGSGEDQPVYLTTGPETPNGAGVRFLIDGADIEAFRGFFRIVCLFDGSDTDATARARQQWKAAKASGAACTYWQQSQEGRWEKKA